MAVTWNYTNLARHYAKRPDYSGSAIDHLVRRASGGTSLRVCDIGAGTGHLTRMLLDLGCMVEAVEPNEAMREIGIEVTRGREVRWHVGTGEQTGQPSNAFDLVTFGSSFNVADRAMALKETARILKPKGWFACMWNHRELTDPLQQQVEAFIKERIPVYGYGTRREDQTEVIAQSGLFQPSEFLESAFTVQISHEDYVEAWRSHATLAKQAGVDFLKLIDGIETLVRQAVNGDLTVPYVTRMWIAQLK